MNAKLRSESNMQAKFNNSTEQQAEFGEYTEIYGDYNKLINRPTSMTRAQAEEGTELAGMLVSPKELHDYVGGTSIRILPLNSTDLVSGEIIESVGMPIYVDDVTEYSSYGITDTGWYVFCRIKAKDGVTVTEEFCITGAAGYIALAGAEYIDIAVKFEVAAMSQIVLVNWGQETEKFIFKATDLAIRNLDYRVTFYVYDIDEFATWEYALTTDETFADGKYYYTKDENDVYTLAEVTVGEAVPADTYYVHSHVTFEGMARNITYRCNTVIDCPMTFILPEIEDDCHGCWFEIRFRHAGSYSSTLVPPEGVKVATEHTQAETAGMNMVNLHYSSVGGAKVWRFMNTHSTIPA